MAIKSRNFNLIKLLVNAGVNVNQPDHNESTPVHHAVQWANANIVKLLLDSGANINALNKFANTPLSIAVCL